MKSKLILLFTLIIQSSLNAQSKKEQIEILTNRIDSFKTSIQNERLTKNNELEKLATRIKELESQKSELELRLINLDLNIKELNNNFSLIKDSFNLSLSEKTILEAKYKASMQRIVALNILLKSKNDSIKMFLPEIIINRAKDSIKYTILYYKQESCIDCVSSGNIEQDTSDIALPIAVYSNGKFIDPPTCGPIISNQIEETKECNFSKKELVPLVLPGKKLFSIVNGYQSQTVSCIKYVEHGLSDWTRPSAIIQKNLKCDILTNNPYIGVVYFKDPKLPLNPKPEPNPYGGLLYNDLISKIDIDMDGYAEYIYKCEASEGYYFRIYSFKNNKWQMVYSGGYQGV